jgi:hypothetical protein
VSSYVQLGEVHTWYDEFGEGEPVALLHPGGADARAWAPNLDALAAQFRVSAVSEAFKLNPDVITLDHQMPLLTGEHALEHIREICPNAKVVVVSAFRPCGRRPRRCASVQPPTLPENPRGSGIGFSLDFGVRDENRPICN